MESRDDFAILHTIDEQQFLVDTTFNHNTEEHELTIKFWHDEINGYTSATLRWYKDKSDDFEKLFLRLKDIEYAKVWLNEIKKQITN